MGISVGQANLKRVHGVIVILKETIPFLTYQPFRKSLISVSCSRFCRKYTAYSFRNPLIRSSCSQLCKEHAAYLRNLLLKIPLHLNMQDIYTGYPFRKSLITWPQKEKRRRDSKCRISYQTYNQSQKKRNFSSWIFHGTQGQGHVTLDDA